MRRRSFMRLLSWSLSSRLRGWQGKGQIWQPTLAGCMGSKFVTPPMLWPQGPILTCFPLCPRCPVAWRTANAAQPTLEVQVPLARALQQPRRRVAARCGSQRSLGLYYRHQEKMDLLLLVAAYTNFTTGSRLGATGALRLAAQVLSG